MFLVSLIILRFNRIMAYTSSFKVTLPSNVLAGKIYKDEASSIHNGSGHDVL